MFNLFDENQKARLFSNLAEAMRGVPSEIIERQLKHFDRVGPAYGKGVREAIKKVEG